MTIFKKEEGADSANKFNKKLIAPPTIYNKNLLFLIGILAFKEIKSHNLKVQWIVPLVVSNLEVNTIYLKITSSSQYKDYSSTFPIFYMCRSQVVNDIEQLFNPTITPTSKVFLFHNF